MELRQPAKIDWLEWNDETFQRAKAEGKPIPTGEHIKAFKQAVFEAEVETYPIIYLIKSEALQRRFEVLVGR